jgi:hypothetical protein
MEGWDGSPVGGSVLEVDFMNIVEVEVHDVSLEVRSESWSTLCIVNAYWWMIIRSMSSVVL